MKTKAFTSDNEKEAALYFDKIISFGIGFININDNKILQKIKHDLIPEFCQNEGIFYIPEEKKSNDIQHLLTKMENTTNWCNTLSDIFTNRKELINDYAFVGGFFSGKKGEDTCISLMDLQLIDTSSISWEEIFEIRKDKELLRKLRNLRLFFENENRTKKWDLIEAKETFLKMLDEYESAIKMNRFNVLTGSIHTILSKENLITSLLVGFVGEKLTDDIIGGLIGTSITLVGNTVLNVVNTSYNNKKLLDKDPVAYVFETKKRLNQN